MRRIAALLVLVAAPALALDRPSRADENYAGVMQGTVAWTSLSATERAEVAGIARLGRQRIVYERCRKIELAGRDATRLDAALLALKCGAAPSTTRLPQPR